MKPGGDMLDLMAPKKKLAKKEAQGRSRERGETRTFTFELTPALDDALEDRAAKERRTKKAVLTIALERYLADGRRID